MRDVLRNYKCFFILLFTLSLIFLSQSNLSASVVFNWSGLPIAGGDDDSFLPSGSAEFSVSGSQLIIILTNNSSGISKNWQVLTGLTWDITDSGTLTPVSALTYNSQLVNPANSNTDLSSEWAFRDDIAASPLGSFGVGAMGNVLFGADSFGPGNRFDTTTNLFGPASLDGIDAGIVGPNLNPNQGFGGPTVQGNSNSAGQMRYTFNFTGTLTEDDFTNVNPMFGSEGAPLVPEPATLSLLGLGLLGLLGLRKRKEI